jgi:ribosomal protein S18 acetylase RimI-like enzyme
MNQSFKAFDYWTNAHNAPYHFPMTSEQWYASMYEDVDSDGRKLFDKLTFRYYRRQGTPVDHVDGMAVYGTTAFGFDDSGEISQDVHYKVIRDLSFDSQSPEVGQDLLAHALEDLGENGCIYAYFHYFGLSGYARHGKLHESQGHIHDLLLENGFTIEHENVYYSRELLGLDAEDGRITIGWKEMNSGNCLEFAASTDGQEFGWGQVHFLPQGNIAYLRWIYIDEKRQHQGLGTAAMATLCAQLHQKGITRFDTDTAVQNTAAQGYYEKTGFSNRGITRSYYKKKD